MIIGVDTHWDSMAFAAGEPPPEPWLNRLRDRPFDVSGGEMLRHNFKILGGTASDCFARMGGPL